MSRTISALPRERKVFLCILALWTTCNFLFISISHFGLSGDEAQYWGWSRQLDWGYYSKPPMIAWVIALLTHIGGTNAAAIRSGAVLFTSGALFFIYGLTRRVAGAQRGESAALLAVCVTLAMTSSWAGSVMLTIDAPLIFFWAMAMYTFHRAVSGERGWWVIAGIALGLGMLTKYTMLVLTISFIAYLVLFDRAWLRRAGPYIMLLLMLLAMIPVLRWNVAHDWVSVRHTASIGTHGAKSLGKTVGHAFEFFGGQLGIVSPILFGLMVWSIVVMKRWMRRTADGDAQQQKQRRDAGYLFLCAMVLFGFYSIVAFTRKTEPNWPACAYLAGATAFAWAWVDKPRSARMHKLLLVGAILGCAVGMLSRSTEWLYRASTHLAPANAVPGMVYLGPLHFRAAKEPTNRLFGGCELGRALSKYVRGNDPNTPFICSDNYQFISWAAFYTEGRPYPYCANLGDRRYNQYDLWGGWESLVGRDALFILGDAPDAVKDRIDKILKSGTFERLDGLDTVQVWRQKTLVKTFTIARLHRYTGAKWPSVGEMY